jgi:hypothetical protein
MSFFSLFPDSLDPLIFLFVFLYLLLDLRPLPFPHSFISTYFLCYPSSSPPSYFSALSFSLSLYSEEFPKKQILMTVICFANYTILLKENGQKIVQLYLTELDVSWFVGNVLECVDCLTEIRPSCTWYLPLSKTEQRRPKIKNET